MNPTADSTYDELPYEDFAFFHTHPSNLAAVATLCGLATPPVATCSVLELGCGAGFNLLAMSESLPDAHLVGVDLSRRQIEAGRGMAVRVGAANVDLRVGDVAALDGALGKFDFIVAHGLLSWVPAAVREAIFHTCRRHLRPDGIAYLSYNAYPGWHLRGVLLEALQFHADLPGTPIERVRHARAALERMAGEIAEQDSDYARVLRREIDALREDGDAYVFHEFLESDNHPLRFSAFAALAAASGLRYFGEARYGMSAAAQRGAMRRALDAVSPDPLRQEQYHDLLRNRYFRQSLLCHQDRQPATRPPPGALDMLAIASKVERLAASADAPPEYRLHDGSIMRTDNPLFAAILGRLSQTWPCAARVPDLIEGVDADMAGVAMPPGAARSDVIREGILVGYIMGWWHLHAHLPAAQLLPGERPRASALARLCATGGATTTNLLHLPVDLDPAQRAMLVRLDGTMTVEQLAQALNIAPASAAESVRMLAESYLLVA